ncbi:MAG: AAA family ATPase [Verrucomicrobia bacterium]|nr:AAA family ATPase [Verrucomicrobiota bacterium]
MAALDQITLNGFKSIRELKDFKLEELNVLVGANGAGKSNLVDLFRLLRAMADGGLQSFVTNSGGADGFFFNGPKETKQISTHLKFGSNQYRFALEPTVASEMMIREEATLYTGGQGLGDWHRHGGGVKEARLPTWKDRRSGRGDWPSVEAHVYRAVSSWMVYHFHDTSSTAPMRRPCAVRDFRELRPDAGNIAAFLLKIREENAVRYQRIRETVQWIAPFFDDFVLEPQMKGENELVRLEWRQHGSTFPFQPWQFSDGTIRFICLATALLQPRPPSTVVIDEPELGLHPYALEVLAQLLKESAQRTQLIVSTQSAPLLNQFEPQEVVVVERLEGASHFRRLEEEPLAEWLKDYSLGELLQKNVIEAGPTHA